MTTRTTQQQSISSPSAEAQARAILTYCINSRDALLYAALLGASSAQILLNTLWQLNPEGTQQKTTTTPAANLDNMFMIGSARWGHRASRHDLEKFHRSVSTWRNRLKALTNSCHSGLLDWMTHHGDYWIIAPNDPYWPQQLNDLSIRSDWAPPLCLWGMGSQQALTSCSQPLAVVGSRNCNEYGRFVAHQVGLHAARDEHLVVSGGALGADASAHWGALSAQKETSSLRGCTVAVFAGGLNHIGPLHNQQLFQAIKREGGALISELYPETVPEARRFLLRNRIIAGLAHTVIVTQARYRSGALNTATWACELGREVYAAPGSIDTPENTGCNRLIHNGKAMILISATDLHEITHRSHEEVPQARPEDTYSTSNASNESDENNFSKEPKKPPHSATKTHSQDQRYLSVSSKPLTDKQEELLRMLDLCSRQGIDPTCENIVAVMNKSDGKPTNSTTLFIWLERWNSSDW